MKMRPVSQTSNANALPISRMNQGDEGVGRRGGSSSASDIPDDIADSLSAADRISPTYAI